MTQKTFLYEYSKEDFENLEYIEKEAFKKADEINDKFLDVKILMDEITEDLNEYLKYLEVKKISKIHEFRGGTCIEFDDELRHAIVNTLKKSLTDTQKSVNFNTKKIALNRVING
ncbi:MAG: hypothetical protein U0L42_07840 [Methanobrevibacter sp.]|uniref:hypothetical protein n=1 Tax=Methanobrevibacter sp. TaxID=66852 RepID=UPI002E77716A|nr:hypothetical protein [Methanobrevibacter sp.]MEE0935567.1 hypothetical protein [Methanobrevibacter sp.]